MISFQKAYQTVLDSTRDFGEVVVPLSKVQGRVLTEDIIADRDFPPFDRATKDGIAIAYEAGRDSFAIKGIAAAGAPQLTLNDDHDCVEIMTGAVVPENADTVVMYEHLTIENNSARLTKAITKGQNIHIKGSDEAKGSIVLDKGSLITPAEIGILASVGKSEIRVKRNPKVTLFSTGDELVPINQKPLPHQIRQSNAHTMRTALLNWGIAAEIIHVDDKKPSIQQALEKALTSSDILLLSGGVSKGKYDYLPEVLEELGVKKLFHRVQQRPGKPFWFGQHSKSSTTVFGFPGNPTSTFANFHVYFMPWLNKCLGRPNDEIQVTLKESLENNTQLTRFIRAKGQVTEGQFQVDLVLGNGSGDLTSLAKANGFVQIEPQQIVQKGDMVRFIPTRRIV